MRSEISCEKAYLDGKTFIRVATDPSIYTRLFSASWVT